MDQIEENKLQIERNKHQIEVNRVLVVISAVLMIALIGAIKVNMQHDLSECENRLYHKLMEGKDE